MSRAMDNERTGMGERISKLHMRRLHLKGFASPEEMLRLAAATGDTGAVRMVLLESAVNINAADESGWTALHWAAFCGHAETAAELVRKGANMRTRDKGGYTPLDRAGPLRPEIEAYLKQHLASEGN